MPDKTPRNRYWRTHRSRWTHAQTIAWNRKGPIFPYTAQTVPRAFPRPHELEIVDPHFHDLRHDGTWRLFEAGWSIERVALVTGHRDWNMLRRYTQLRAEDFNRPPTSADSTGNVIPLKGQRALP